MKRVIGVTMILSLLLSTVVPETSVAAEDIQMNKSEYLVQIKNVSAYQKQKKKWDRKGKIVVNHKNADEKYLDSLQSAVVKLTKKEANCYDSEKNIIIEENHTVEAQSEKTFKVDNENPLRDVIENTSEDEEALASIMQTAVEVPMQEKELSEYTDDPTKFEPIKAIKKTKQNKEIIPWNIACVAGNPAENKYRGKKVKVALIDSGIDTHDELNTRAWVDFSDKVEGYKPTDNSGHGTSMAGVIAARINGIGFEGIASDAEIYSVKVLDCENRASVSTILKALEWCIENDMDIVNMSFGMDQYSAILANEIKKAYNHGILLIGAAGNNTKEVQYPAGYPEVISVGSIDKDLKESDFSDNSQVDIVAPGDNVQTTGYLGSYNITSGTSVAAAHVTGVAAAVKSAEKKVTNTTLKNILVTSGVVLEDGSRLVNYQSAINVLRENKCLTVTESDAKEQISEIIDKENPYVEAAWYNDKWLDGSAASGHYTMINNMDLSYFSKGASNDTEKIHNRWIVADSAYRADSIEQLSASGAGNGYRNSSGAVASSGTKINSPYHAKSQYALSDVTNHLEFLYELARRRLILGSALDLTATNYSGNTYYSVPITQIMKRRIIVDLNVLYNNLTNQYAGTSVNITKTTSKGYMVLGLFLHLVQDLQAHRAKVTAGMLYSKSDGTEYYGYNTMVSSAADSKINGGDIDGISASNFDKYWALYNAIKSKGSIPMIRLKDFMKNANRISVSYGGKTYYCTTAAAAYEDNPYFYQKRFETALSFSRAYIDRMNGDTGNTSKEITYYYADDAVPLYESSCSTFY